MTKNWKQILKRFKDTKNMKINTGLFTLDEFFQKDEFPIIVSLSSNMSNIIKRSYLCGKH